MTSVRSHFAPDNIEGIKEGDEVYFHVTNLEQDWDVPHGFAIKGANTAELLIMPGETSTVKWIAEKPVCSLCIVLTSVVHSHQEMQGYVSITERNNANIPSM